MVHENLVLSSVHRREGYTEAARAGDTVYICGQVALDVSGALVGRGDVSAQARQVYRNLHNILTELGGGLEHIVKTTTYLTDAAHIGAYRAVRDAAMPLPRPPNTLAIVQGLASPDYLIEVEAVAVLG